MTYMLTCPMLSISKSVPGYILPTHYLPTYSTWISRYLGGRYLNIEVR